MILLLVLVIKEYLIMNMLIWNCWGALNPYFIVLFVIWYKVTALPS